MVLWKVAGAPFNPKGILVNSNFPEGVTNAVLAWSLGEMGIW